MSYGLPPLLEEIAGAAGLDAALALAEAKGGQKIYLPDRPGADHWLSRLVGHEAAARICELHGVRNVEIPRGPAGSAQRLRRRIARMIADGASSNEIARACEVSFRTVTRHRARARGGADDDQGVLL